MASKEAALDSKLQSLSRDDLIHFVKKQATQISKLKQNQQGATDSPPKPKKGGTPVKPLDGQSAGGSATQGLSGDVGQLVKQIEELTTCKETLEETLKNSGDMIIKLRRENESLKQEAECFAMQKSTFMESLQMFEEEKKNLVKDLATMTEARNEALKCLEHAKQTSNPTSGISDSDLKELYQERDDLQHLVNKLNRDLEYEKTLLEDQKVFWNEEKTKLIEDLDSYKNQLADVTEQNEQLRLTIEDLTEKSKDVFEELQVLKENAVLKEKEYACLNEKYKTLVAQADSNDTIVVEMNVESKNCSDTGVQFDASESLKSSEDKFAETQTVDPTESLKAEISDLKQQLLNVCNERAKLSEALKLTNQAKEETRAALETEKQMLSEKNFNLQTANTYLTSKVMTMSKQLESIPEEQRSSPEEDVSMESIHSEDPANSSVGASETPNKSFEGPATPGEVSHENINTVEHRLASINIVIAQLEKEKDEICRKENVSFVREGDQENEVLEKEKNQPVGTVLPVEPDLVSSCVPDLVPTGEKPGEIVQQQFEPQEPNETDILLAEVREERDCLLTQIDTLRTHETDLIDAQALLERRLEDLVSEKESIFHEVQGLIGDLNKYVSRNVDLENEKQRLSKLVTELGSSAEIVTVLKDSLQADKLILAEKDEQIHILEDQVSVLQDSVGQYKSRYDELEAVLSEFETKFSEMERNTGELQEKNLGSEEERVKLSEQLELCREAVVKFHSELDYQKEEYEKLSDRFDHVKQENEQLIEKLSCVESERDQMREQLLLKPKAVGTEQNLMVEEITVTSEAPVLTQNPGQEESDRREPERDSPLCHQIDRISVDVQTTECSIDNLEEEVNALRDKLNAADLLLQEKEVEITGVKENLDILREQKENLENSFDEEKRLLFEDLEKSKDSLETAKSSFSAELAQKDERIEILNTETVAKVTETEELKKSLDELQTFVNEMKEINDKLEGEIGVLKQEKCNVEKTLNQLQSTHQGLKNELDSSTKQLTSELTCKIEEIESLYDQIDLLKNGASAELTKIVEENQKLHSEIQNLHEQLEKSHNEKVEIMEKMKEDAELIESEKESLTSQNFQLQEELSNRANDINELKDAITNLENSLSELEVQYERIRDEKRDLSEKLTEVIDQSASEKLRLSEELQKLRTSSVSRENSFSDLKTQHSEFSDKNEKLTQELETLRVEKNKLCGKLEDLETIHAKELEKMLNDISRLETLNEELKHQKNKVYDMFTELERSSIEKDKANAELLDKVSRLEQELENKRLKIETLAKDIQWHTENLDDVKNQLQQVVEESSSLKEKLSDSQLEKGNLGKELDNMKFQFEAFSQSDSRLRSDIAQLENVKIGIDHRYNLLSQEVDRFLNSFIDDVSDLLNVEQPPHDEISEVTQKIEFVDKQLKHKLTEFTVGAKEIHQSKDGLEKKLEASLKSLSTISSLLSESETEVLQSELGVKEIKKRCQKVESSCKSLLKDRNSLRYELNSKLGELETKIKELNAKEQELKGKNKELQSKEDELRSKDFQLNDKILELGSKDEELLSKTDELESKNQELDRLKEELNSKEAELIQKTENLASKDTELKCKDGQLNYTLEELNSKDQELKCKNEDLEVMNANLRTMEEKLSGEVVSLSAEVKKEKESLEAKLNESEAKNQKLKQLVLKVKKEQQATKNDMEKDREKLSKIESDLAAKTEECSALETSVSSLTLKVQDLENNLVKSNDEKAQLEESMQELLKELDVAREAKCSLESQLDARKCEIERIKADVMQGLETEISKTQQVVEVLQSDLEKLSEQKINMELEMTRKLEQKENQFRAEVEKLKAEKESVEREVGAKEKLIEQMEKEHGQKIKEVEDRNSQGENDKQAMLDLEMADMRRSLESLKEKLEKKSNEAKTLHEELESAKSERDTLKKEKKELEDKSAKFKQLLLKQKKELEELRKSESEWKSKEAEYVQAISGHISEVDNLKIQTASDAQSNVKLLEQIGGLERRNVSLTDLVDSLKGDLKTMEQRLQTSSAEFEQYKARVHTVFKQQKEKSSNVEDLKVISAERDSLKTQMEFVKSQLSELSQDADMLKLEKERLQKECHSLSLANAQLTQQMNNREVSAKQKVDDLKFELEKKNNSFEIMESGYKNQISNLTKYYKDKLQSEEKEHRDKLEKMQEQFEESKSQLMMTHKMNTAVPQSTASQQQQASTTSLVKEEPLHIITSPLVYSTAIQQPVVTPKSAEKRSTMIGRREPIGMERSDGDGVESDLTVLSSSVSQPSPKVSQEFISFEKLISPSKPPSLLGQGQQSFTFETGLEATSPSDSSTPVTYSKRKTSADMNAALSSSLTNQEMKKQQKKIAHLTSLLNESEMNIQRLTDQSQLLKDEIRRLEGSWDETAKNMEYLKNILIKFFKLPNGKEKEQLVPVLTMLLKLNNEEKNLVAQLSSDGSSGSEAVPAVSGWSSYMPRWSGLM